MSTLKVTHLQNESNSAPSISISSAVGGGVTFAGISTFHGNVDLGSNSLEGTLQVGTGATIGGSTNTITASTNGSERLRITSAGNLGIGIDPNFPIYTGTNDRTLILGTGSEDSAIQIHSSGTGYGGVYFGDSTSGNARYNGYVEFKHGTSDDFLRFGTGSTERLRITSVGKVGINQGTPTAFMHVKSGANDGTVISTFEGATNNKLDVKFVSTGPAINVTAGDPLVFELGGSEKLRITSAGSVGIGTNAPAGNFEVRGNDGINVSNATRIGTSGAQWRLIPHNGGGSATNLRLYEGAGATEVLNIQKDGKIILMTGNGIQFGSPDSGGSVNSQTLDDYEEGTWTPQARDNFSGGNQGSFDLAVGYYTKIGNQVTAWGRFSNANTSGMNGSYDFCIAGLPFAAVSTLTFATGTIHTNFITFGGQIAPRIEGARSSFRIQECVSNSNNDYVTVGQVTSGTADAFFELSYFV